MAPIKLNVIKPSVNNMTVRVFVRAAGLPFVEQDVFGQTRTAAFLARNPAHLTPMIEEEALPKATLWESCAIMQYLCNKHGLEQFYPREPSWRAMIDSAMFYLIGSFYPYLARATYPALGFPLYAGEVGYGDADAETKETARRAAVEALSEPLDVFQRFYMDGSSFIGGERPSIADLRLACTLEFLAVIDYELPDWTRRYMGQIEDTLGNAYTEPASDVRGYISHVRSRAS
jgi:glutathione S-transferase